jgi:zinc D-Ala-D-Ala carboxypeptidase
MAGGGQTAASFESAGRRRLRHRHDEPRPRGTRGGGAGGVATKGAAGVEVAQSTLDETQTAILELVPYLDPLPWVFIAVALGGIGVTIYARIDNWKWGRR